MKGLTSNYLKRNGSVDALFVLFILACTKGTTRIILYKKTKSTENKVLKKKLMHENNEISLIC